MPNQNPETKLREVKEHIEKIIIGDKIYPRDFEALQFLITLIERLEGDVIVKTMVENSIRRIGEEVCGEMKSMVTLNAPDTNQAILTELTK